MIALAAAGPGSTAWSLARLDLHGVADGELAPDVEADLEAAIVATVAERHEIPLAELRILAGRALRRLASVEVTRLARLASDSIQRLVDGGRLSRDGDRIRPAGVQAAGPSRDLLGAMDRLEAMLTTVAPPALSVAARTSGCPPAGIQELERSNRIVRLDDDLAWASGTYRELAELALALAADRPLTPAAFRDATGTSRKYVVAILEDLDRRAILHRTAAGHVPGPRGPIAAAIASGTGAR